MLRDATRTSYVRYMFYFPLLDFDLPLALLRAHESAIIRIRPGRTARGLSDVKVRVLYVLSRTPEPVGIRPLGRLSGLMQKEIRKHAHQLIARGLARWDQADGDQWPKVAISDQGRAALAKIGSEAAGNPRAAWGGLASLPEPFAVTPEMRAELFQSLRTLRRAAEGFAATAKANAPDDTGEDPVFGLPLLLHLTRNALLTQVRPSLTAHGFTEPQWRVLRLIADAMMPVSGRDIAGTAMIQGGGALTRIANALHARGLIQRDRRGYRTVHDTPRKRFRLEISDEGREKILRVQERLREECDGFFTRLDLTRMEALVPLLGQLGRAVLWIPDGMRRHPFTEMNIKRNASSRASVKRWQALVKAHGPDAPRRRAKPKMEGVFWTWPGMPKRKGLAGVDPLPVGLSREIRKLMKPDP